MPCLCFQVQDFGLQAINLLLVGTRQALEVSALLRQISLQACLGGGSLLGFGVSPFALALQLRLEHSHIVGVAL